MKNMSKGCSARGKYFSVINISFFDVFSTKIIGVLIIIKYSYKQLKGSMKKNLNMTKNIIIRALKLLIQKIPETYFNKDKLIDPIQFEPIEIDDFGIADKGNPRCIDFTHDEAVNKHRYYFDLKKQTILSACRPTNIFWSNHISNMMQQNYTLQEYSDNEIKRSKLRESILNRNKI